MFSYWYEPKFWNVGSAVKSRAYRSTVRPDGLTSPVSTRPRAFRPDWPGEPICSTASTPASSWTGPSSMLVEALTTTTTVSKLSFARARRSFSSWFSSSWCCPSA